MLALDEDGLDRLNQYLAQYRDLYSRADQARSFELYVRGLVDGGHRKNVESIAESIGTSPRSADLAQSLQHFVSQSPWDYAPIVARYRELMPRSEGSIWIVHDGIIVKKGSHSVGVQRQFARTIGKKVNCQVAIVVSEIGDTWLPLTSRLYLPAQWLRENEAAAVRTIPSEYRQVQSKAEVALALLDEVAGNRVPSGLITDEGYQGTPIFQDGLERRGIRLIENDRDQVLASTRQKFEWLKERLGFGHFEGRSWLGWHHHLALVLTAYGFVLAESRVKQF